jgi:hypothetical protein
MGNAIELFGFHDGSADLEKTALYSKGLAHLKPIKAVLLGYTA